MPEIRIVKAGHFVGYDRFLVSNDTWPSALLNLIFIRKRTIDIQSMLGRWKDDGEVKLEGGCCGQREQKP